MPEAATATAPPSIERIHAKIGALETAGAALRRHRLNERTVSEAARSFDLAEAAALESAILALKYLAIIGAG